MKIAVAGTGYVGLSMAVLLAQHNTVKAVDIIPEKVSMINNKKSPIEDDEIEEYLATKGVTCTRYPFSDNNDVKAVTEKAADDSDAIYIPTDNMAAKCAPTIGSVVRRTKTPVIAGEEGICAGCGVATLSISYYDLGYKTGLMAADILTGAKNVSEMPIQYVDTFTKKYNAEIATELGVTIPEGYVAIGK